MAFSDARNERDRADTGRNSANHGGRDNQGAERRNREAMARNNARASDQRHRNRLAEINRVAKATGTSATPVGNTGVSKAGRVSSALQGMSRDYRDIGNSTMDNIGNFIASQFGFNQQRPTMQSALDRVNGTPAGQVTDRRAGWGFDPAGLIGGMAGTAFGVPGLGMAADWISSQFNRPLEIGMGPSVFGGMPSFGGFGGGALSPGGQMAQGNTGNYGGVLAPQQTAQAPAQASAPAAPQQPQQPQQPFNFFPPQWNYGNPGMSGLSSWGIQPTGSGAQTWNQPTQRWGNPGWR